MIFALFSGPLWFTPKHDTRKLFSFTFSLQEHHTGSNRSSIVWGRTVQVAKRLGGETMSVAIVSFDAVKTA